MKMVTEQELKDRLMKLAVKGFVFFRRIRMRRIEQRLMAIKFAMEKNHA